MKLNILFVVASLSLITACQPETDPDYVTSVDDWHGKRLESLKRSGGWLSLVGRDWLVEGENTFDGFGTITVTGDRFTVELQGGIRAEIHSPEEAPGAIIADRTRIHIGTRQYMIIKRGAQFALRAWDDEAPTRVDFKGIERFPVNSQWKITARWEPFDAPKTIQIPTQVETYNPDAEIRGKAIFELDGKEYSVVPTVEDSGRVYFLVFGDKTSGRETYGGGRFLYIDPPVDGKMILDFNKAYNPPCVFTDFATCPVPLPENKLPIRIDAGEKVPAGH